MLFDPFQSHRLVMVVGASGSGKSSPSRRAGPGLRAAGVAVHRWCRAAPLEHLRAALIDRHWDGRTVRT
jgi:hypothetical protein